MKRIQLGGIDLSPYMKKVKSVNKHTYNDYFQIDIQNKLNFGLHKLLNSIFPIQSKTKELNIRYLDYNISYYDYDEETLIQRQMSYTMTIKVNLSIEYKDNTQPYNIYLSHIPIMLDNGCFLINGTKKVIIYHLCKTGGLYFNTRNNTIMLNISTTMGSLITFSLSSRNILTVSINKSKKLTLLMFIKLFDNEQINRFIRAHSPDENHGNFALSAEGLVKYICLYTKLFDVTITNKNFIVHNARSSLNEYFMTKITNYSILGDDLGFNFDDLYYAFLAEDLILKNSRRVESKFKAGMQVNDAVTKVMSSLEEGKSVSTRFLFLPDKYSLMYKSLNIMSYEEDQEEDEEEVSDEYEYQDNFSEEEDDAEEADTQYKILEYQITPVLRDRINAQLDIRYSHSTLHLTEEDFILSSVYIISSQATQHSSYNLYNTMIYKKIKKPEEFIDSIISSHLYKVKKNISIRNNFYANFQGGFDDIINYYSISTDIKKVFNVGTAIQYLDQTNILSEISHLRRVSAIYSSISDRYRIADSERGVNLTQYGRICAIETPEGHNIGLITAIACTALINDDGLLVVPYFKVYKTEDGTRVDTENLFYLTAEEEFDKKVASFSDIESREDLILCRYKGSMMTVKYNEVEYFEILPYQMLSYASSLIPFIENNDARRALMSANMQKQALPLTRCDRPIIGTGVERIVVENFTKGVIRDRKVKVMYADSKYIFSSGLEKSDAVSMKALSKFTKTNMKTCVHEYPIVDNKETVDAQKPLFNSSNIKDNEITLGNNVLVAFLSWNGYNFEDSIVVSERIRRDSKFESIYINDLIIKARDLEDGVTEQFSATAPSISAEKHKYLDSLGIVKEGTYIRSGMIAAGRIIPLQSSEIAPEDNILSIIFNKKISSIRDISYKIPYNEEGCVINVIYYSCSHPSKSTLFSKLEDRHDKISYLYRKATIEKVREYYNTDLEAMHCSFEDIKNYVISLQDSDMLQCINETQREMDKELMKLSYFIHENRRINIDSNVSEFVSFCLVQKRYLEVGDKLTGRYGNKGVVSVIVPMEDMPFLDDGTPIDMLLSPLGIPNRLNIGQVFEMHLGAFSYCVTKKVQYALRTNSHAEAKEIIRECLSPILEDNESSISNSDIDEAIEYISKGEYLLFSSPAMSKLPYQKISDLLSKIQSVEDGKMSLRCGITGEYYNRKVSVGLKYMLKLNHMAKDKISVRETGSYSVVSQQPLPRKVNCGGQRVGEMEVWALESYGVASIVHEIITVKSDDIRGRIELYSNILKHKYNLQAYIPETVNVISSCIKSACLNFQFIDSSEMEGYEDIEEGSSGFSKSRKRKRSESFDADHSAKKIKTDE